MSQEVFQASAKALKKGGRLFSYEPLRCRDSLDLVHALKSMYLFFVKTAPVRWVMTDRFDPKNAEHAAIKKGIEIGDGIEAACVFMHSYNFPVLWSNFDIKSFHEPDRNSLGSNLLLKV